MGENKALGLRTIDKTRPMEHSGKFCSRPFNPWNKRIRKNQDGDHTKMGKPGEPHS